MMKTPRYNVMMRTARAIDCTPANSWILLSHKGRTAWVKRTAQRHLQDVSTSKLFTDHYDAFKLSED